MILQTAFFSLSLGVWLLVMGCRQLVVGKIGQSNQQPKTNNRKPITNTPKKCFPMKCQSYFVQFLTVVKTFSYLFSEKYFLLFVIPPFHHGMVISLILNGLSKVELWVEYGWNYMKFHPNSTHNSTLSNALNAKYITIPRWKSGTSFA